MRVHSLDYRGDRLAATIATIAVTDWAATLSLPVTCPGSEAVGAHGRADLTDARPMPGQRDPTPLIVDALNACHRVFPVSRHTSMLCRQWASPLYGPCLVLAATWTSFNLYRFLAKRLVPFTALRPASRSCSRSAAWWRVKATAPYSKRSADFPSLPIGSSWATAHVVRRSSP
jgi:hypothetical protein